MRAAVAIFVLALLVGGAAVVYGFMAATSNDGTPRKAPITTDTTREALERGITAKTGAQQVACVGKTRQQWSCVVTLKTADTSQVDVVVNARGGWQTARIGDRRGVGGCCVPLPD